MNTRGLRNNNPLNIRIGNHWMGEVLHPTDPQFEQFVSLDFGLRAGFSIIRRYIIHYKRDTVAKIISSWAPDSENNTAAYISQACVLSGLKCDEILSWNDREKMVSLVCAMCKIECGFTIRREVVANVYDKYFFNRKRNEN